MPVRLGSWNGLPFVSHEPNYSQTAAVRTEAIPFTVTGYLTADSFFFEDSV